jgi:signal transduction histidine kinase
VLSEENYEVVRPYLEEGFAGRYVNFEFTIKKQDGSIKFVFDLTYVPHIDTEGTVLGLYMLGTDVTERKRVEEEFRKSREQLRNLAIRLQVVREEERTVIAREIHDEIGQALTGLKIDLSWLREHLTGNLKELPERIDSMISLVDSKLDTTHNLAFRLRPAMLDDLGLEAAIECEVQDFSERTNCEYMLELTDKNLGQDHDRDTTVFRILQEALTNVVRHAKATHIDIALHTTTSQLVLTVKDNGVGIDENKITDNHSLGLIGMRERASVLDGQLNINKIKEGGTQVVLEMPLTSCRK